MLIIEKVGVRRVLKEKKKKTIGDGLRNMYKE